MQLSNTLNNNSYYYEINNLDNQILSLTQLNQSEIVKREEQGRSLGERVGKSLGYGVLGVALMVSAIVVGIFSLEGAAAVVVFGWKYFDKAEEAAKKRDKVQDKAYQAYSIDINEREQFIQDLMRKKEDLVAKENERVELEKIKFDNHVQFIQALVHKPNYSYFH